MFLLSMHMSFAYQFFGRVKCTVLTSSKTRQSLQAIISILHLISFRQTISHSSSPTQGYQPVAGLTNVLNMSSTGFSRNDFLQFFGTNCQNIHLILSAFREGISYCTNKEEYLSFAASHYLFCTPELLSLTVAWTLPSSMITDDSHPGTMFACHSFWRSLHLPCCWY